MKKIIIILFALLLILPPALYFIGKAAFNSHFEKWGNRLVELDRKGLLSDEFGAAWADVLQGDRMQTTTRDILAEREQSAGTKVKIVDGAMKEGYPSLSIVKRLNEVRTYSNAIRIADRNDHDIAVIRTDHTRARFTEFPDVLVRALVAAEDERFYTNSLGFEFDSFVRAVLDALRRSVLQFHPKSPRGTSTITQQVAKLFVSRLDGNGMRYASHSLDRKVRELRISAALRKSYSPEEILEVYLNHCVTSDNGLIGVKDISEELFGKPMNKLNDGECLYISRMVKWGRNVPAKIRKQCRIDMPRVAATLKWDAKKQKAVLRQVDAIEFKKPRQIRTESGHLVDLANEYWLMHLAQTDGLDSAALKNMDLIDPSSLIRRKGNLTIRLTIDLPLQKTLEALVNARGYGKDTTIRTDVRIGSEADTVHCPKPPVDTTRIITVVKKPYTVTEAGSGYTTHLKSGDTLIANIRFQKISGSAYKRSRFLYTRGPMRVDGQYFAYCILDASSGKLLAYYSRDKIGSRAAGLLRNRTPNGSSTAKPICNALNFDLGLFNPTTTWTDRTDISDSVRWGRTVNRGTGEVTFHIGGATGRGYSMHNHGGVLEGCDHIFNHLASSNNVLGVETVYRLDRPVYNFLGQPRDDAFGVAQLFDRIGATERVKNACGDRMVTGVRVYKELCRTVGADADSMTAYGKRRPVSDSLYSIALGTLELTLYEQAHMFNMLYNNDLVLNPKMHPSLVIQSVDMAGSHIAVGERDTVVKVHPFADVANLRPAWLGMHKRLNSNRADGLSIFDITCPDTSVIADTLFSPEMLRLPGPASNFAKSGTTDDVLRPYNADITSTRRTNYGLWNAVVRVDMAKLAGKGEPEIRDITVACLGECNTAHTGVRDGKTLHKFLTSGLLHKAGVPVENGFFSRYESYIKACTPAAARTCGEDAPPAAESSEEQD